MLIRLISVITLSLFMLLMISGASINVALYRSLLVFMILFSVVYLTIFFLNVVKGGGNNEANKVTVSSDGGSGSSQGGS